MFSSPQTVIFMECGHPIHKDCFHRYMEVSYRCPLCHKSITKMDALFLNLANIIKEQPMPQEYLDVKSVIFCNDCSAKCSTPYHFLGLRCQICQSFNTMELDRSPLPGDRTDEDQTAAQTDLLQPGSPSRPSGSRDGNPISSPALHSPCSHASGADSAMQGVESSPSRPPRYAEPEIGLEDEDEDEELNYWGGEVRSVSSADESDSGDEADDSDMEEGDEEDDDDNDDGDIVLFGHR